MALDEKAGRFGSPYMLPDIETICPGCGREIEEDQTSCPHCGRVIWRHVGRKHWGCLRALLIWLIISVIILLISYFSMAWYDNYVRALTGAAD